MRHIQRRPVGGGPDGRQHEPLPDRWWVAEHGLETLELALITALMMIILVAGIPVLGGGIGNALGAVTQALSDAGNGIPTN